MDLGRILEKKGIKASGDDNRKVEDYIEEHPIFKGYSLPKKEYIVLEQLAAGVDEDIENYEIGLGEVNHYKKMRLQIEGIHVTGLQISSYKLKNIPESIGNLTNLEILDLSYNELGHLPSNIGRLTKLQKLELWCNKLKKLPEETGNLAQLNNLDLGFNRIITLPKSIKELKQLKNLCLYSGRFPLIGRLRMRRIVKELKKNGVCVLDENGVV